jgi:succinoglycan biosynthesis protein ExoU
MPDRTAPSLGVVIAARDAAATVGAAVSSALADPRVAEVILVDDASRDATAATAAAAAGGDARLRILSLTRNVGPAAARNRALEVAASDALALLDADDRLLPGRFGPLLAVGDWDLVADNVVFVDDPERPLPALAAAEAAFERLSLAAFVQGNVARPGRSRGEYGFLKPVLWRPFLQRHGLRYDPGLRLGEDYDLYVRALRAGGRFLLTRRPGYLALVRPNSLSAHHRTEDLGALAQAIRSHLAERTLAPEERRAMRRLLRQMEGRHALRAVLDVRGRDGIPAAVRTMLARPGWVLPVTRGILRDKLAPPPPPVLPAEGYRLLLPAD